MPAEGMSYLFTFLHLQNRSGIDFKNTFSANGLPSNV